RPPGRAVDGGRRPARRRPGCAPSPGGVAGPRRPDGPVLPRLAAPGTSSRADPSSSPRKGDRIRSVAPPTNDSRPGSTSGRKRVRLLPDRTDLDAAPVGVRMPGCDLDRLVEVLALDHGHAADEVLGLGERAV